MEHILHIANFDFLSYRTKLESYYLLRWYRSIKVVSQYLELAASATSSIPPLARAPLWSRCNFLKFEVTFRDMTLVNIIQVTVLDNPTAFTNPFQFEITFECLQELQDGAFLCSQVFVYMSIKAKSLN